MQAGDRVKIKNNPSRVGVLTSDPPIGSGARQRLVVLFPDGEEQLLKSALAPAVVEIKDPYSLILRGDYAGATHLRGAITQARLSGKLANLIYSLNTTNTQFFPYQFKPVLQYLDSPSRGLIVADEVGLGKTIEAGLIWTELRARQDAGRLLVVCPAMLREKWCWELKHRFGVKAQTVDSAGLLEALNRAKENPSEEFALVVSMQGSRPPASWNSLDEPSNAAAGKLARFLDDSSEDDPMLDLVIIDEAHYLRNKSTQTHLFARLLRQVTDGMVMLSATPIQMASSDLFNLLNLLDADAFPLEWVYDQSVKANAPIIALRDKLQHETVTQQEMREALEASMQLRWLDDNEQVNHLLSHMPTDQELASYRGRAKYAELLDRVNPRAKVITRTLKRDVQELRVQREPVTLSVIMTPVERDFYDRVTDAVRDYCEANRSFEGFLLTIPQRQMSSCLAGAYETWTGRQIQPTESSDEEFNSELAEGTFDRISESRNGDGSGVLLQLLTEITWKYGKGAELVRND
jgi:SNF2 family DNA or RNA helicase